MITVLPQMPSSLALATTPAQSIYDVVNELRQNGQSNHAGALESLQQQADANGSLTQDLLNYVNGLTRQSAPDVTFGAWTAFTPTVTSTMTLTGPTITAAYSRQVNLNGAFGKTLVVRIRYAITLGGVASGLVSFSTPVGSLTGVTQMVPSAMALGTNLATDAFAVGPTIDCYARAGNYALGATVFYIQGEYETD